jgi:hypothetical protein
MKLKAFDCTAAYLQTEIDKEMYVRPAPGLMSLLGRNQSDVWSMRVFITNVKGTFLGMSESEEASKRR